MKKLWITFCCVLITAAGLQGQTAPTSVKGGGGSGAPEAATDQDLNIRAYIELLRTDVRKEKSQIMGQVMQLDAEQATKFWPIYKEFETDLSRIGDQIVEVVKDYTANYDKMTGPTADRLATKLLTIEQQRNELKRKYYERVKETLDPVTAMRFLQVENQLERLIDLQVASSLPVIRGQ